MYRGATDETCAQKLSTTKPLTFQKTLFRPPSLGLPASRFARRFGIHALRAYEYNESFPGSEDEMEDESIPESKEPCRSDINYANHGEAPAVESSVADACCV